MVDETQVLEDAQGVRRTAKPKRIETDRASTRCLLDGIDAGLIPGAFLLGSHGVLRLPSLAMPRRFMAAANNLFRQLRVSFDSLTDHVRCHLNACAVPQVEQAWNAFLETILVPFLDGQIRIFGSRGGKGLLAPLSGWAPVSNCMEIETTSRALSGQKPSVDVGRGSLP
jgi:hypothetical protein